VTDKRIKVRTPRSSPQAQLRTPQGPTQPGLPSHLLPTHRARQSQQAFPLLEPGSRRLIHRLPRDRTQIPLQLPTLHPVQARRRARQFQQAFPPLEPGFRRLIHLLPLGHTQILLPPPTLHPVQALRHRILAFLLLEPFLVRPLLLEPTLVRHLLLLRHHLGATVPPFRNLRGVPALPCCPQAILLLREQSLAHRILPARYHLGIVPLHELLSR
jgi:hypothetical protein